MERKVFEHSYQKVEADKTAKTVYSAQIAQLKGKVTVYPYPVKVDYEKNRVYKAGKPSTVINLE